MGAHVGLHPDNLSGKFKNKVTILFHDYILRLRIYRPAGFLFETDQNIKNFFFGESRFHSNENLFKKF